MRYQTHLARGPRAVAYSKGVYTIQIDAHDALEAPDRDGRPHKWVPCECCGSLVAVPSRVHSTICEDCNGPCVHHDCGLARHEHYSRDGKLLPCEPITDE